LGVAFPTEITEAILDNLNDDQSSLKACALVCSAWLASTRPRLFHKCTITTKERTRRLRPHIRHLDINRGQNRDNWIDLADVESLLSALPSLRSLSISKISLDVPSGRNAEPLGPPPKLGALDELSIKSSNLSTYQFETLFRLLSLFTEIHRVELVRTDRPLVGDEDDRFNSIGDPPDHIKIAHLSALDIPRRVVLKLLTLTESASSLQTLWYDDRHLDWNVSDDLGALFAAIGPRRSLRRVIFGPLQIFLLPPWGPPQWMPDHITGPDTLPWASLNFSRCEALEEFNLRTRAILAIHANLFATLPASAKFVRITLVGIRDMPAGHVHLGQWVEFDQLFSAVRFRHLTLVLDWSHARATISEDVYTNIRSWADGMMPRLKAQGRLVVTDTPRDWW
ncbi:hypothetical protein C8T65DRAFT_655505, partial [Cerioporus squamosus]